MYQIETDHQVVAFGTEVMTLFDNKTGGVIATATRTDGTWTIHTVGIEDTTFTDRPDAITGLLTHALTAGSEVGYSTLVPDGLAELP